MKPNHQLRIGRINTSAKEIIDLIKSWTIISLAFAIMLNGLEISFEFLFAVIISGLTVGTAFLLHEMGHKFVAQKYGCFAEFRSFDSMLWLALAMSFFGFVFAAPGAVMIHGRINKNKYGKISSAGVIVNLILAFIFTAILISTTNEIVILLAFYGMLVNSWLALFNLLPFWNFDGKKVLAWNKGVYAVLIVIALCFMFLQSIII